MEGIAVFTWEICKRMVSDHPKDQFYFFFDRNPHPSFHNFENVTPIIIKPQARHPLLWKYWFEYALPKAIKKLCIDVFFSPESYLSLSLQIPTVMTTHDLSFLHYPNTYKRSHLNYYIKYESAFHKRADHIIAVSETTKSDIVNQYNIPPTKISVAHNAVRNGFQILNDNRKNQIKNSISKGFPYILYVGSIHPRKNIIGLIKGFEIWQDKNKDNHRLVLFGRWAFGNNELEKTLKNSSCADLIYLRSDHDGKVEDIMGSADCFIYPSFHEGFGIPIIEAMACGIPVVTSNRGAMKEIGGDAAIYINPDDIDSIANGINSSINNKQLNFQLKHKAKLNLHRFSWQKSAELIYKRIKKLG